MSTRPSELIQCKHIEHSAYTTTHELGDNKIAVRYKPTRYLLENVPWHINELDSDDERLQTCWWQAMNIGKKWTMSPFVFGSFRKVPSQVGLPRRQNLSTKTLYRDNWRRSTSGTQCALKSWASNKDIYRNQNGADVRIRNHRSVGYRWV